MAPAKDRRVSHFYLYSPASASATLGRDNVFYIAKNEDVVKRLVGLFHSSCPSEGEGPYFAMRAAHDVNHDEQVFLNEALDSLADYELDPDPGIYDPPPSKATMKLVGYGIRARHWEGTITRRNAHEKNSLSSVTLRTKKTASRRFRSALKRQIFSILTRSPEASDREVCRLLDENDADLLPSWESKGRDRTFRSAYKDLRVRQNVHDYIYKVRRHMRDEGLL